MSTEAPESTERWLLDVDLAGELRRVVGTAAVGTVTVAIRAGSVTRGEAARFPGDRAEIRELEMADVCLSCFAKPLTAMLMARVARETHVDLDADVRELPGVTIRQLLNHTHGLDGSSVVEVPRMACGRLDLSRVLEILRGAESIAQPGELYSYGNIGAWVAAALIEAKAGVAYHQALAERLLDPLGITLRPALTCATHGSSLPECCPSLGGRAALSPFDLLRLTELSETAALLAQPAALPGWAPERGACLGWKYYGHGWYGHNADASGCSAVLRFNPERSVSVLVAAMGRSASLIHARLFAEVFPELNVSLPWKRRARASDGCPEMSRYTGVYANRLRRLTVRGASRCVLALESSLGSRKHQGELRWLFDDTFVSELPGRNNAGFLQFIRPTSHGFAYLWNGREVFRRLVSGVESGYHPDPS